MANGAPEVGQASTCLDIRRDPPRRRSRTATLPRAASRTGSSWADCDVGAFIRDGSPRYFERVFLDSERSQYLP